MSAVEPFSAEDVAGVSTAIAMPPRSRKPEPEPDPYQEARRQRIETQKAVMAADELAGLVNVRTMAEPADTDEWLVDALLRPRTASDVARQKW